MRDQDLRRTRCIYENVQTGVSVFEGLLLPSNRRIAIKDQVFSSLEEANQAVEKGLMQTSLSANDLRIASVYGVCMSERGAAFVVTIAMEMLENCLMQEIETRQTEGRRWTEEELLDFLRKIVETLEKAQRERVCHRDIKPQNLFLEPSGEIKVTDFGASKKVMEQMSTHTIQGSPYFLSPLLKRELLHTYSYPTRPRVAHNPFKSDVYSLGLTVLMMAHLKQSKELSRTDQLTVGALEATKSLPYSRLFQELLRCMLQEDEGDRPDFIELRRLLQVGVPRTSDATTAASFPTSLSVDLQTYIDLLNTEEVCDERKLMMLFKNERQVAAVVSIQLPCTVCKRTRLIDITDGCPADFSVIFCSEECLTAAAAQPQTPPIASSTPIAELQKSLQQSFHDLRQLGYCVACQRRRVEIRELLLCSKCQKEQEKRFQRIHCEECVQCGKKWQKQSTLSRLFHGKRVNDYKLPCMHRICSKGCLKQAVYLSKKCPACSGAIPAQILQKAKN